MVPLALNLRPPSTALKREGWVGGAQFFFKGISIAKKQYTVEYLATAATAAAAAVCYIHCPVARQPCIGLHVAIMSKLFERMPS